MTLRRHGDKPFKALAELTAHLRKCYACRNAMKTRIPDSVCYDGQILLLTMAQTCNSLVKLHTAAAQDKEGFVYPCPDKMKHGAAYAMTAQPMMVTAFQPELF